MSEKSKRFSQRKSYSSKQIVFPQVQPILEEKKLESQDESLEVKIFIPKDIDNETRPMRKKLLKITQNSRIDTRYINEIGIYEDLLTCIVFDCRGKAFGKNTGDEIIALTEEDNKYCINKGWRYMPMKWPEYS